MPESPLFAATIPPSPDDEAKRVAMEKDKEERAMKLAEEFQAKRPKAKTKEDLEHLSRILKEIEKIYESEDKELRERLTELAKKLETRLNERFLQFDSKTETVTITPPELPRGLTQEHLDAVKEALGSCFEERILPSLKDLNNLDDAYVSVMYPEAQNEADEAKGLVSYRPDWWDKASEKQYGVRETTKDPDTGKDTEVLYTWGDVYLRSMRHELETLGGSLVLLDTATKPKDTDGSQQYGSTEGTDPSSDPLLPLFKEAFGPNANRFNHSWDDIEAKLIPLAEKKISDSLKAKGLAHVNFDVILVPATLDNIEMTFNRPESSTADTWEWTSTPLLDDKGNDTVRRLVVGLSDNGGAGVVGRDARSRRHADLGARLAVVYMK